MPLVKHVIKVLLIIHKICLLSYHHKLETLFGACMLVLISDKSYKFSKKKERQGLSQFAIYGNYSVSVVIVLQAEQPERKISSFY
jgi:hypothetical protein